MLRLLGKRKMRKIKCKVCPAFIEEGRIKFCKKHGDKINHGGRGLVRTQVRARDNFTCLDCGIKRTLEDVEKHNKNIKGLKGKIKSLDVHHINGQCGKNSYGYDKLKDMDGLITLCHKCHYNRLEHRMKNPESRQKKVNEIISLRAKGLTFVDIGKYFGTGGQTVSYFLTRWGKLDKSDIPK